MARHQRDRRNRYCAAECCDPGNAEAAEQSGEVLSLQEWLEEIRTRRPLSKRERLERALHDAIKCEDYERAAQVRDQLKNLGSAE